MDASPRENQPQDQVVILLQETVHQLVSNENIPWSESQAWQAEIEWIIKTAWNYSLLYLVQDTEHAKDMASRLWDMIVSLLDKPVQQDEWAHIKKLR